MHLASDMVQDESPQGSESGRDPSRESEGRQAPPPVIESPPTSPQSPQQTSPWWTAPGGKPVDIPAFGRSLIETLIAILFPAQPQPISVRVRAKR